MRSPVDDVVEVDAVDEPDRPRGRTIAIAAGVCLVLLAIALVTNLVRGRGGQDDDRFTPAVDYFTVGQIEQLVEAPVRHLGNRKLHYLRLVNDGSVGFGLCSNDSTLVHFAVEDGEVVRLKATDEPCYGGFDYTEHLGSLIAEQGAAGGDRKVEVMVDSHNRLSPLIEVTQAGVTKKYGIDGKPVRAAKSDVGNDVVRIDILSRLRSASGGTDLSVMCAWLDTGTMSIEVVTGASERQYWEYVGTPVLIGAATGDQPGQVLARDANLTPYLQPSAQAAAALGPADVSGVCLSADPGRGTVVEYYTGAPSDDPGPPMPRSWREGPAVVTLPDGSVIATG